MKKRTFSLLPALIIGVFTAIAVISAAAIASAAPLTIPQPIDLPPEMINFGGDPVTGNFLTDPNILAALIGVIGLLFGSFITIFATYFMRWMDNRREDKREDMLIERSKREKEFQIKQEIYKSFLNDLAHLETFPGEDMDNFKREWTKTEVKVDLVATDNVRKSKENLQKVLLELAEKNLKAKSAKISPEYLKTRDQLLDAIREDIDIFQAKK